MPSQTDPLFQLQKLADQVELLTAKMVSLSNVDEDLHRSIHSLATESDVLQLRLRRHVVMAATLPENLSRGNRDEKTQHHSHNQSHNHS
jgi:hypothetical protein